MPFKSVAQRRYMHAQHPEIARRWEAEAKKGKSAGASVKKSHEGWLKPVLAGTVAGGLANQFPRVQDVERERKRKRRAAPKKGKVSKAYARYVHSDDPNFNHAAAQKAFDLVMKMDDDTAEMFTHIVITELFTDDIEKNLGTLQRHLDEVLAKRLIDLKQAHLRLVSKGMDPERAVAFAQAIALISKAMDPEDWEEKLHPRGTGGRFRTVITHNQAKEIDHKTAQSLLGIETPDEVHDKSRKMTSKERIQYQDEYRQLADFLHSVNTSTGGHGNHEVLLHFQDKSGRQFTDKMTGTVPPKEHLADPSLTLVGAEARPTTLTAGGAAFGLSGALGHPLSSSQVAGINAAGQSAGDFTNQWTGAGDALNSNKKLYDRTAAAGQFMGQVGPPGSKTQLAGKFAQIIGTAGPEAERVIGPTARKTAYRYRGTEKTPDAELVRAYAHGVDRGKATNEVGGERAPHQMVQDKLTRAGRAPTWDERDPGRAEVMSHLRESLPNRQLYALQLASGNTPPSEGVIINANGQLATQAVGYADDHYLPFNLKNLKGLKGGEYIRTRSVGGLTAEDVYTGLISGARQVTVISRSGTFTMTFEDDFRGGRRHSDKARRMTRRYEQLLDAVQSGQVERAQIPPEIKATIASQVRERYAGDSAVAIRNAIKDREKEYRDNPDLSDVDEQAARHLAIARFNDDNSPDAKAFIRQRLNDLQRKKQVNWQLNGDGYEAALTGLQEQFPYYIKTASHPLDEEEKTNLERDKGYVEPGRNRPTEARGAGLFGTMTNPGLKRDGLAASTASRVDYQRGRFDHRVKEPEKTAEEKAKAEGEKTETKKDPKQFAAEVAQKISHRKAADDLFDAMQRVNTDKSQFDWLNDRDQFNRMMETPEGPAAVDKLVDRLGSQIGNLPADAQKAVSDWKKSGSPLGTEEFVAGRWPSSPIPFKEAAYQKGAPLADQQAAFRRVNSEYGRSLKFGGNIGSLNDRQLKEEHDSLTGLLSAINADPAVVQAVKGEEDMQRRQAIAAAFFGGPSPDAVSELLKSPEHIETRLQNLQRMRTLKANGTWPEGTDLQHTARVPEQAQAQPPGPLAAALNEAKPPSQIFGDQGGDIVDAEVVEESAHDPIDIAARANMMRQTTGQLVKTARARLAQTPERDWEPEHYDLKNALDAYEADPPTEPAEQDAAHEHLYELHVRAY